MRDGAGGGGPKQELWLQREVSSHCFLAPQEGAGQGSRGSDTSALFSFVPSSVPPGCAQPPRAQCQAGKGDKGRISSRETNFLNNATD